MKLSQLKVEIITDATAAGLKTAVNAFLGADTQRTVATDTPIRVFYDGASYVAVITYTE